MAKLTQKYESVLVLSLKPGEEAVHEAIEKFKKMISDHGTLEQTTEWGQRKLAYPINYETEGYYVLFEFESKPDFPAELDRVYQITDHILRTLIVAVEKEA